MGLICCDGSRMCGGEILLDYPSVGATENIMMAATAAKGRTVIRNTAREPEVADLARALNRMGASVFGAGSSTITVEGGQRLCGMEFVPVPDRIAAGTYLCGAAMTGGDVTVTGVIPEHMRSILHKLGECGCAVTVSDDAIPRGRPKRPQELTVVETLPYPGFPTDMQAAFLALCTVAEGTSVLVENVFDNRFRHRLRACAHERQHHRKGPHGHCARGQTAFGRRGNGLRPARRCGAGAGGAAGGGHDRRQPGGVHRPRLRVHRGRPLFSGGAGGARAGADFCLAVCQKGAEKPKNPGRF